VYRRAYVVLVGNAVLMGAASIVVAIVYDKRLVDPEGAFLGPSWLRLPLLLLLALALDLVPRTLWFSRMNPSLMVPIARQRLRTHWTRERLTLVTLGIICFYVVYVSYRNLKSFLPFIVTTKYDRELHLLDRALFFGHEPATVFHVVLGTNLAAHGLSYVYLWFLPMVPLGVTGWVVWSRNMSIGYWFVTSECIAWTLGTISYYALPTVGPGFEYVQLYVDLANTPTTSLMASLDDVRDNVVTGSLQGAVQSVAGFASLHCALTLLVALVVQYTVRNRIAKWACWTNFGLTVLATIYFGWHYIADDVAGVVIALVSFYIGGIASGQKFERKGLASQPTTMTSAIPVSRS
jgi:hypothetical protein